jgi:hypothetical protein
MWRQDASINLPQRSWLPMREASSALVFHLNNATRQEPMSLEDGQHLDAIPDHPVHDAVRAQERLTDVIPVDLWHAASCLGSRGRLVRSLLPQAGGEKASVAPQAAVSKEPIKEKTPRVDGAELPRRTFDFDVFVCVRCGGRRSVLAYMKGAGGVRAILDH